MRNVVLGLGISLDGYIARPNGAVDFLFMPKGYSMAPFFATIDTAIMGRKTLDAALQMGGSSFGGSSMATFVFSRSKPAGERDGLVFINQSPATFIRELRKRPGKNIWLMGGGELARDFLKADLVDEEHLMPRQTPLYDAHRKLGARMVDFAGWEMPVQYTSVIAEHEAVRTLIRRKGRTVRLGARGSATGLGAWLDHDGFGLV